MRVAILGFGLIGGSIAHALRVDPSGLPWTVAAWSPTGAGPARAADERVVDLAAGSVAAALDGAELVVLAAPPLDCLGLVDELAGPLRGALGAALVTDVASTKRRIASHAARAGLRFVGGHPMAGRETTGYGAADRDLFVGRPWVVLEGGASADVAAVERLATACRAVPIRLSADSHDAAVAAISHLPLVLSAALVEAVAGRGGGAGAQSPGKDGRGDWPVAARLAASGWRDMTRLARGDAVMGAGIAATNADALAARIRDVRDVLGGWLAELEREGGPDAGRLEERLRAARSALDDEA